MANAIFDNIDDSGGTFRAILDTTATGASALKLGAAGGQSGPCTWHIQILGSGTIGTFLPKFLLRGAVEGGYGPGDAVVQEFFALNDTSTALTTAQSALGAYVVPADEWDVYIDYTAGSSPMTILARAGRQ